MKTILVSQKVEELSEISASGLALSRLASSFMIQFALPSTGYSMVSLSVSKLCLETPLARATGFSRLRFNIGVHVSILDLVANLSVTFPKLKG